MREILFRGKRIDNGKWVYGYYAPCCLGRFPCSPCIVPDPDGIWEPIEVDPFTIGQYTGLTDKNGKEIFEGDILKVHDEIPLFDGYKSEEICYNGKVMYLDNRGMYVCEGNGDGNALFALNLDECQVIGNIHDNPELLEGQAR